MMLSIKKVSLGIIVVFVLLALVSAEEDDDKKAEKEEEERDPWDKSTDKYRHKLGDTGVGTHNAEEPVKIDVTEVSESEVHSERSKVCKNCKLKDLVVPAARKAPSLPAPAVAKNATTTTTTKTKTAAGGKPAETKKAGGKTSEAQYFSKNDVDDETKEQINDATDEQDPADVTSDTKHHHHRRHHHHKRKKQQHRTASKKQLNPQIDYNPGNVWEYPYPYHHDLKYGCGENDQNCDAQIEAKEEAKEQDKKRSKTKKKEGVPKMNASKRKISEIGTSWQTPCFYNADTKKFTCKQLIPSHYYGPPSAGWGGFQPGHTGAGWGVPHWNKRCHTPRVGCKQYHRQPMKNSWFFYPRQTAAWQGDPASWYRYNAMNARNDAQRQGTMRYKVSRPEDTIKRITPLVVAQPRMRNNIGALHEWITFLENERAKDRELERYRLQLKDKENERRYNLDVLRYKQAQDATQHSPLADGSKSLHREASQMRYYSKQPQEEEQEFEKKAVHYALQGDGLAGTDLYNDRK